VEAAEAEAEAVDEGVVDEVVDEGVVVVDIEIVHPMRRCRIVALGSLNRVTACWNCTQTGMVFYVVPKLIIRVNAVIRLCQGQ
jgi:hypothetical protein